MSEFTAKTAQELTRSAWETMLPKALDDAIVVIKETAAKGLSRVVHSRLDPGACHVVAEELKERGFQTAVTNQMGHGSPCNVEIRW